MRAIGALQMTSLPIQINTPGKITLYHYYHQPKSGTLWPLQSLFVPVDVTDEVEIKFSDAYHPTVLIAHKANGSGIVIPEKNQDICLQAAKFILQEVAGNNSTRVSIRVRKGVPIAAGMGGGSSDAAAVLKALGQLLKVDPLLLPAADLARISFDVVPFVRGGPRFYDGDPKNPLPLPDAKGFSQYAIIGPVSTQPLRDYVSCYAQS